MEFHRVTQATPGAQDKTVHIMSTHHQSKDDATPLQLISAELLRHYREAEIVAGVACAFWLAVGLAGLIVALRGAA